LEEAMSYEETEAALRRLVAFVKRPGVQMEGDNWWVDHVEAILRGNPLTIARPEE